jgi:hypothetical protein
MSGIINKSLGLMFWSAFCLTFLAYIECRHYDKGDIIIIGGGSGGGGGYGGGYGEGHQQISNSIN